MKACKGAIAAIVGGVIVVATIVIILLSLPTDRQDAIRLCKGTASCIIGTVIQIVDGDTLDVESTRVRLALVNTPEIDEPGYNESKQFTSTICPVGSEAVVDEDDGQPEGNFGRMLAKVSCGDKVLNAELLNEELGEILPNFCTTSEFRNEDWARQYGC